MTQPKPHSSIDVVSGLRQDIVEIMRMSADLQRVSSRTLKGLWRDRGLSERGLYILELVHAGLDRPSKLIEYFDVLPSTITFETEKLVSAGLLERRTLPADRRVVQLSLTPKGLEVHRETVEAMNNFLGPALSAVPAHELATFFATFRKVVDPLLAANVARAVETAPADAGSRSKARKAS